MQLKNKPSRARLAAATLSLLGAAARPAAAQDFQDTSEAKWDFDTGVLVYSEGGGRVQATEPVVNGVRNLGDDRTFSVKLVFDTLTGASPNGATPASTPQTFSGPSGAGHTYTTPAGQLPLDPTFKDQRVAVNLGYGFPFLPGGKLSLGGNASQEHDFGSVAGSLHYSLDLFQHNTTLAAGGNYESDTIDPVGGAPTPLAVVVMGGAGGEPGDGGGESEGGGAPAGPVEHKTVTDLVGGITQVLSPNTLVQLNYSISQAQGYQTDPYKILSVVGVNGEPLRYVYESRPESRSKQAVFFRIKRFMFAQDVFDLSYRYMSDDWGIASHTADVSYRWNASDNWFVEPHARWYTQTAADFYHAALYDGEETTVSYASADPRLGAFDGYTGGLKLGRNLANGGQLSLRLEYYQQVGKTEGVPQQAAAGLSKFNLAPDLSATMLTLGYRFKW